MRVVTFRRRRTLRARTGVADFFCDEVLTGKTAVEIIAESERAVAYRHTRPEYPAHIVVISRQHLPSLLESDDLSMQAELIQLVRHVAVDLVREYGACRVIADIRAGGELGHLQWQVVAGDESAAWPP
ncbi:MAG TPA: HIT domain-containing protein [Candidatus Limnocylindria bacterium]|nr:HIT domain-containing protein [Candidatus Limnocylindria bacterium]